MPRMAPTPLVRPTLMGVVNVTPDSFSDGGHVPRGRGRRSSTAGGWRPRARRSSTSAASPRGRAPSRSTRRRSCGASCRWSRAWPAGGPGLDRHHQARRGAGGAGGGRDDRQRRVRLPLRARAGRAGGRRRGGLLPDAHARRAAHDAGRPALRRRGLRGEGLPRGAAGVRGGRGRGRGARLARSRASASARPWSTTSSCCGASDEIVAHRAARWWSAPRARASSASSPAGEPRASGCRARSRPT